MNLGGSMCSKPIRSDSLATFYSMWSLRGERETIHSSLAFFEKDKLPVDYCANASMHADARSSRSNSWVMQCFLSIIERPACLSSGPGISWCSPGTWYRSTVPVWTDQKARLSCFNLLSTSTSGCVNALCESECIYIHTSESRANAIVQWSKPGFWKKRRRESCVRSAFCSSNNMMERMMQLGVHLAGCFWSLEKPKI